MNGTKTISYLILTVAVVYSLVMPAYGDIKLLMVDNKKYEDSIDSIKMIDDKILELTTKINNIDPEVREKVETMLPSSINFVKLVSDIDNTARKYGATINNVSMTERNQNPDMRQDSSLVAETNNSALLSFTFITNYNNFLGFIDELETSLRIMDIKSLQVKDTSGSAYEFNIQYEVYWLPK